EHASSPSSPAAASRRNPGARPPVDPPGLRGESSGRDQASSSPSSVVLPTSLLSWASSGPPTGVTTRHFEATSDGSGLQKLAACQGGRARAWTLAGAHPATAVWFARFDHTLEQIGMVLD